MICFINKTSARITYYMLNYLHISYLARVKYYIISNNVTRIYMKFMDSTTLNQADRRSDTFIVVRFTVLVFDRRVLFPWVLFSVPACVYLLIYYFYRIIDRFN